MRVIYLDCFSGISGDMTLAALVDAGADRESIEQGLLQVAIEPFSLEWKRVLKCGVSAWKVDVLADPNHPPQHHRTYKEIAAVIEAAEIPDRAKQWALAIFKKIGVAEGKVHDIPLDQVHFHEVGAIDSIADVVGVALALDQLNIEQIISAPAPLGYGHVHCDHGKYPVPAPATLEMIKGLPIRESHLAIELTTPTGAGILSGIVDRFADSMPAMRIEAIGYGAGTKDIPNQPNVLRVVVGELTEKSPHVHGHGHGHEHGHEHTHEHEHEHK